jgi:hypothetical protein
MGIAERKAKEIMQKKEREDFKMKFALRSVAVADDAAPSMCDQLFSAISAEVREFANRIDKASSLRAERMNANNLTIETTLAPLTKLVLLKKQTCIQGVLTSSERGFRSSSNKLNIPPVFFATDADFRPCFSDGDRLLDIDTAVSLLLEPLFDIYIDM